MIPTILTLLGMALAPAAAPSSPQQAPSEIAAAAPVRDWRAIAESDLLVMDLAPDRAGRPRRVVIQLMPAPFSQAWIGNIRRLAAARWWDGAAINRVQDDYVAQWGGDTAKHPVPAGLAATSQADYVADLGRTAVDGALLREVATRRFVGRLATAGHDAYAPLTFTWRGWPIAAEPAATGATIAWPVHCYGMVGVGRDMPPDAGSGAELYAVIGHAPRHLDRNIALVGRAIEGIELLSALPRGTELYKVAGGGTLIDTAPSYGQAEGVVGDVLANTGLRNKVFIATKLEDFVPGKEEAETRDCLKALKTSKIDLLQLHNVRDPNQRMAGVDALKAKGICRYTGITTTFKSAYAATEAIIKREKPDFLLIDYAIDNRDVEARILPACQDAGTAVLIALPFGRGRLFRTALGKQLPEWAAEFDCASWGQFFLKFLLAHPAVHAVAPGTSKAQHMIDNLGAGRGRLPDAKTRERMAQYVEAF